MSTNNTNNDSPSTGNKTDEISALSVPHPVTKDEEEDKYHQHTQKDGARDSDNHLSGDDEEISEEDESEEDESEEEDDSDDNEDSDEELPNLSNSRFLQGTAAKAKADVSGAAADASEGAEETKSSYEELRKINIKRNNLRLKSLGLLGPQGK